MENNKIKTLLDKNYASKIEELIKLLINDDEPAKAAKLLKILSLAVDENSVRLKEDFQIYNFYQQKILELSFLSFSLLDEKNETSLFKNNFSGFFSLKEFDLLKQINRKLLGIVLMEDRDQLRIDLIKALTSNIEKIVANHHLKTVKEWLNDYIVNAGRDSLSRAQYLSKLKMDKDVNAQEQNNLLILFKTYEFLDIPSSSPEGLEEEPAIIQDGKLYIFKKGFLEPVPDKKYIDEAMELADDNNPAPISLPQSAPKLVSALELAPVSDKKVLIPRATELEEILDSYSPASLEYK